MTRQAPILSVQGQLSHVCLGGMSCTEDSLITGSFAGAWHHRKSQTAVMQLGGLALQLPCFTVISHASSDT